MGMTSNKPYLVRAFYDWIVDNDCTPYVVVDAMVAGVEVPQRYIADGQIILNAAPRAITAFVLDNDTLQFNTRFGGVPTDIYVPIEAILGIYARENGEGMVFQPSTPPPSVLKGVDIGSKGSSNLPSSPRRPLSGGPKPDGPKPGGPKPGGPKPGGPKPGGPKLRVVK